MSNKRSKNFKVDEKDLLINLTLKYNSIIENKKTDCIIAVEKSKAWEKIANEFNACSDTKREIKQLKLYYKNAKCKLKKQIAADKVNSYKTGGGTFTKEVNEQNPLLAVVQTETTPICNNFDSSAGYIIDDCEDMDIFNTEPNEETIQPGQTIEETANQSFTTPKAKKRKTNEDLRKFVENYSDLKQKVLESQIEKNKAKTELYKKKIEILNKIEKEIEQTK